MSSILFIARKKSHIVSSLSKLLEEEGHNIIHSTYDLNKLSEIKKEYNLIILYTEKFTKEGLLFIKDNLIENNKPMLVLGDVNEMQYIEEVIPVNFIKKKIICPFDENDVSKEINKYILENFSIIKKKVLVVDDSGAVLRSVKSWLEDNYEVILANSAAMAMKYLAINRPDLILLDYEMPVCNGKQLLERLKSEDDFANIPVIFLTSKNDNQTIMQVSSLKTEGYLLKSMAPHEIVSAVDNFFRNKR